LGLSNQSEDGVVRRFFPNMQEMSGAGEELDESFCVCAPRDPTTTVLFANLLLALG
jgi:hypothetical protein